MGWLQAVALGRKKQVCEGGGMMGVQSSKNDGKERDEFMVLRTV
jgi:hypothetical protein